MPLNETPTLDPYAVLNVSPEADDEQIRSAYLARIKQFPPDRSPVEFERVRDAYGLLRDRRTRAQHTLFSCNLEAPLDSLLDGMNSGRPYVGPDQWLAILKER